MAGNGGFNLGLPCTPEENNQFYPFTIVPVDTDHSNVDPVDTDPSNVDPVDTDPSSLDILEHGDGPDDRDSELVAALFM